MKFKFFQKIIILLIVIAFVFGFNYYFFLPSPKQEVAVNPSGQPQIKVGEEEPASSADKLVEQINLTTASDVETLKKKVYLEVPFAPQAPYAVWDELHNEACEEAVLIMAKYWLENEKLTPEKMEKEILNSVVWQEKKWGGHFDLPIEKMKEMAEEYFGINKVKVVYNFESLEEIKKELSQEKIVIVPCAGRLLSNPYYRQPGPVYHMLLIKGFDGKEKGIITNDPGTKKGKDFRFSSENLFSSIYDWPAGLGRPLEFGQKIQKDEAAEIILKGQKAMLIIEK